MYSDSLCVVGSFFVSIVKYMGASGGEVLLELDAHCH